MLQLFKIVGLSLLLTIPSPTFGQDNNWMEEYDFVYLNDHLTEAIYDVRYAGTDNFVGRPIEGYKVAQLVMTRQAAEALKKVELQVIMDIE